VPVAIADYRNCAHAHLWRHGVKAGRQRWVCRMCGRQFHPGGQIRDPIALMAEIAPYYRDGASTKGTARATGHTPRTISRYFRRIQAAGYVCGGSMSMPKRAGLRPQNTGRANPVSIVNEAKPL